MNKLSIILREIMDDRGLSGGEISRMAGVPQPTVHRILSGESRDPRRSNIEKIAISLNLTSSQLLGDDPIAGGFASNIKNGPYLKGNVPLISWVAAGDWHDPVDTYHVGDAEEWLPCPPDCKQETTFVLGIEGDSMDDGSSNGYRDGEMIFVDGSRLEPKHNIDVVIKNGDGNATFKRLINSNGKWYLKPLNPQWPDKVIELDHGAHIIGTVLFSGKKRLA